MKVPRAAELSNAQLKEGGPKPESISSAGKEISSFQLVEETQGLSPSLLGVSYWHLSSLCAATVTLHCLSSPSLPPLQSPPSVRHRAVVHSFAPPWICPVPLETSLCAFPPSINLVCPRLWRKIQQEKRLNELCMLQGDHHARHKAGSRGWYSWCLTSLKSSLQGAWEQGNCLWIFRTFYFQSLPPAAVLSCASWGYHSQGSVNCTSPTPALTHSERWLFYSFPAFRLSQ